MAPSVVALRRYPVKSMGGEALDRVEVDARGLVGDRWYAVVDADGRLASGKHTRRFRRRDAVFAYAARTDTSGDVHVVGDGGSWRVGDPDLDAEVTRAMQAQVTVRAEGDVAHQDAGAVSLVGTATLDWCADRFGVQADPRRLRVNLVVDTDEPFVEESWMGRDLTVGGVGLQVVRRITRCRMIDIDQDGAVASGRWLKALTADRDACVAVYADVQAPGAIAVGDPVRVG